MKQRVGIARALSIEPKIPADGRNRSPALDALTRGTLQDEVRRICVEETGQTAFMITHDVDEAIFLADKIVLMTNGLSPAMMAEIVSEILAARRKPHDLHKHPVFTIPCATTSSISRSSGRAPSSDKLPAGYDRRHPPGDRPKWSTTRRRRIQPAAIRLI